MVGLGDHPNHTGLIRPVFPGLSDGVLVAVGQALPIRVTAWYRKSEATFSDVLALVSRVLWAEKHFMNSMDQPEPHVLTPEDWEVLLDQLASTA